MSETATTSATGATYDRLKTLLTQGEAVAIGTVIRGRSIGAKILILPDSTEGTLGDGMLDDRVASDARALLDEKRSDTREYADSDGEPVELFLEVFPAPPVLLIVGAVHVAQSLCRFAKQLGFTVIVTDARAKLASQERFPEADRVIQAWPDDAMEGLEIGRDTHVAILTHDPKFDEPALLSALQTSARYIGAVGSRSTNRDRRQRLRDAGVTGEDIARVHGPIGLDIGAETPDEMAISILAEIIATRHGRDGGPLTEASGSIRGPLVSAAPTTS